MQTDISNTNGITKKRIIIFLILSIAIGWATFSIIPLTGLSYGAGPSIIILSAMMFSPAISSILTRLITKEGFKQMLLKPNLKGNAKKYLLIYFGSSTLLFLSGAVYFLIFPEMLDSDLTALKAMMAANTPGSITPVAMLILTAMQLIVIGPIINIIPTMGEELGWRGYLLPRLREVCSDRTALVLTGAVWGFWHLPAIIMGHNYGTEYFGYPWLGIAAMMVFCIVLGIIEGYATIKLNSAIPAAMIHSTANAGAALPILLAKGGYNTLMGPAITGLAGGIPLLILALFLFIKVGTPNKDDKA